MRGIIPTGLAIALWPLLAAAEEGGWETSKLKDTTIEALNRQTVIYHQCISDDARNYLHNEADARVLADMVLKKCEAQLTPLRETFLSEGVSAPEADRYLRKTRTHAARHLLRQLMEIQAVRSVGGS